MKEKADNIIRVFKWLIAFLIVVWIVFKWEVTINAEEIGVVLFLLLIVALVDMIWKNLKS